jgi:GNAT superfamily N-acetyltransferase
MSTSSLEIRHMSRQQVGIALDWAAAEGWNPGLGDADCFFAADQQGFLVGLRDGEPIGCISAVRYPDRFAFLGFYIVRPDCRGKGYGLALWHAAMRQLDGYLVGLDGVVAQQHNYLKSGFRLAHRNIRFQGTGTGQAPADPAIVPLAEIPLAQIEELDRSFFPSARSAFLGCWLRQPEAQALGCLEQGRLAGYGVIRRCRQGYKVGPLFALSAAVAGRLFLALRGYAGSDQEVFLDIPEPNQAALALTRQLGMEMVFETARMYTGEAPTLRLEGMFGITSFELG